MFFASPSEKEQGEKRRTLRRGRKLYHYCEFRNEEFLEHYHKRSNAETTFHMIKSKFGDSVRSKTEVAQTNEVLLKVLCHNICVVIQEMFELEIEPHFFKLVNWCSS